MYDWLIDNAYLIGCKVYNELNYAMETTFVFVCGQLVSLSSFCLRLAKNRFDGKLEVILFTSIWQRIDNNVSIVDVRKAKTVVHKETEVGWQLPFWMRNYDLPSCRDILHTDDRMAFQTTAIDVFDIFTFRYNKICL